MPISSFRRLHERNESNTEMENVNLYPQGPLKAILKNLSQDWVNFDHFGNKLKSKAFSKLYKLVIIKLSVKIFPMRPSWSDSKF